MAMIDHVTLYVRDLAKSRAFYAAALKPIGYAPLYDYDESKTGGGKFVGIGAAPKAAFWLAERKVPQTPFHIAFLAPNRAAVDAFYKAAMAAGAKDNGAPGLRPHYHKHYYGAFVFDLDGYNVEAVCHTPA
ncbi:MAG TPA: VOC family protein [Candidatus Cybelea sp.]|nr:VOC family protein [Candidatus Cybelea sp.]